MKIPTLSNILKVARWEFVRNIKSPLFLVLTFLIPLVMVIVAGFSFLSEHAAQQQEINLAVADRTEQFMSYLENHSEGTQVNLTSIVAKWEEFEQVFQENDFDGILEVDKEGLEKGILLLYVEDPRDLNQANLRGLVNNAASTFRMEEMGLDPREIETATATVDLKTQTLTGEEPQIADLLVPAAAGMALIFAVIFSGQILMYGVIKEKRNRVVELLLSSISSLELLLGKIAGFGGLSLCQIGIWLMVGLLVVIAFVDLPATDLSAGQVIPPLLFFIFGLLMISSIFAAVGATMKEAEAGSQAQGLIILVPMVPLFMATPLLMNPDATWVRIFSHIPPFIPTAVLLRMGGTTLPAWEIFSTLAALILSTALFVYFGAKIFEGTILQYDRPAGWKDVKALFAKK